MCEKVSMFNTQHKNPWHSLLGHYIFTHNQILGFFLSPTKRESK